ncbi:MAG: hypothetical protein RBG13Loki_1863 [Promethearchaeota archaeon CR_4]|nr:MAG: hypothetical protein RBG13Loki_1863 [Candidatus Lokiarchaeota archaeon CR_4]
MKSRHSQNRADKIAEIWGGGGHENRAGFDWNRETNDYLKFIENELIPKLTQHLKNTMKMRPKIN